MKKKSKSDSQEDFIIQEAIKNERKEKNMSMSFEDFLNGEEVDLNDAVLIDGETYEGIIEEVAKYHSKNGGDGLKVIINIGFNKVTDFLNPSWNATKFSQFLAVLVKETGKPKLPPSEVVGKAPKVKEIYPDLAGLSITVKLKLKEVEGKDPCMNIEKYVV